MLSILNEKTIHQRYTNVLLIEVCKYLSDICLKLMNEVFYLPSNHYNLRSLNVVATDIPRNKFLLNFTVYRANQLWQTLPFEIKDCSSQQFFIDKLTTR